MRVLGQICQENPKISAEDITSFMEELADVRNEGIAFDYEEIFEGVRCVASPIFDYSGSIVATLGCSVPTVRITKELSSLLINEVCDKAKLISSLLGAQARKFQKTHKTMIDIS